GYCSYIVNSSLSLNSYVNRHSDILMLTEHKSSVLYTVPCSIDQTIALDKRHQVQKTIMNLLRDETAARQSLVVLVRRQHSVPFGHSLLSLLLQNRLGVGISYHELFEYP